MEVIDEQETFVYFFRSAPLPPSLPWCLFPFFLPLVPASSMTKFSLCPVETLSTSPLNLRWTFKSPKAVLGNRFIVVVQSPVNLHPVKNSHVGEEDLGVVYASESADTVTEQEVHSKAKAAVAAALADRKSAHEQQMVSGSLL